MFTDWTQPEKILFVLAEFFLYHRVLLGKIESFDELNNFFDRKRKVNVIKFMKNVEEIQINAGPAIVSFNVKIPICEGQYPLFTNYPKYKVQSKDELAEEILEDMRERENLRKFQSALNARVARIEDTQKEFVSRTEAFANNSFFEGYHQELPSKKVVFNK